MSKLGKEKYWIIGISVAIASFIIFFVGVKAVLGNEVTIKNIMAFIGFSVVVGIVAAGLVFFNFKITFVALMSGVILGFFEMYKAFLNDKSGFADVIGIFSLFVMIIISLSVGMLVQFIYYLRKRTKKYSK